MDNLLTSIDSTKYPGVTSANKVLDKSLMILQIALKDHSIDGLTPSAIANILTDKFRINTTNNAVSMVLGRATNLVNRIPDGQGFIYKIMAPGEKYLTQLDESEISAPVASPKKKTKKKATTKKNYTQPKDTDAKNSNKNKQGRSSIGQKEAVLSLIDSGFFNKGKTGPEVQSFLNTKRGLNFSTDQLRMSMLRLVREEKLDRDANEEGQYEYTKSKI